MSSPKASQKAQRAARPVSPRPSSSWWALAHSSALSSSRPTGHPAAGAAAYQLAELHRLRGETAEAEEAYRRASRWGREPQPGLALLRLAQGQPATAQAAIHRAVRIELRSAEPRLFPQNPNNDGPTCAFIVEAPNGLRTNVAILFQTTSFDAVPGTIVRYEWDFGDGTGSYAPDNAKVYKIAGTYIVVHQVTDDDGAQDSCFATLTIQ